MKLKIGSLCSGIGGLERGLEQAGVGHVVWQVEINEFARGVLAKHWPNANRYEDLYRVGRGGPGYIVRPDREPEFVERAVLEPVDLLCAGFPCQPASLAGKRKGREDDRWLWPEVHRIITELRPPLVVLENVYGLVTLEGGEAFRGVLSDLASVRYDAEWSTLRVADLEGPHRRERVFILAWLQSLGHLPLEPFAEYIGSLADAHGAGLEVEVAREERDELPAAE